MHFPPMRSMEGYPDILRNPNDGSCGVVPTVVRRKSFDHDFLQRGSPANLEGVATGSTRSDSPSCNSIQMRPTYMDSARFMNQQVDAGSHIPVTRQYSPSFSLEPPPPQPPPRPQVVSASSKGATPPLPPPSTANSQAQYLASPQVQHMLKRMSPVSQNQRASLGYSSASQSSTPQRGTSPSGRMPVIAQNSQQIQHQLNQKLQNLSLYNGSNVGISSPSQVEPPPPYPVGSMSGVKMGSPLPYSVSPQSRQSPTLSSASSSDYNSSLSGQKRSTPSVASYPSSPFNMATTLGPTVVTSRPVALSAWSTRQTPIIMQSVKSTLVQKPILQTAIAPTSPPSYATAIESSASSNSSYAVLPSTELSGNVQQATNQTNLSDMIPTTDPPSYASSMALAMAAQHGMAVPTATTSICHAALSSYNLHMHAVDVSGQIKSSVVPLVEPVLAAKSNYPQPPEPALPLKPRSSPVQYQNVGPQRKYSSPNLVLNNNKNSAHVQPLNDPSLMQMSTGSESLVSSSESQPERCQTDRLTPPPPPPPPSASSSVQKTTIQSPIPERKHRDREEDEDDVCETKVKNYSPQAFKFFMEQHMENIFKSRSQRMHRSMQLENEMAKVDLSDEARCQMRRMLHQKESNYIRLKRAKMDKSMFVNIKTIGVGAFGEVALVFKIDTKHLYAMKTLRKSDVLKRNQVAHVKAERDILAEADNEWVVKLYYSFQDSENLYFVMDYIPGGDLMSLLIKLGIFENSLARFYIAELVCAIESVHKMGFIHRDIKPDNILIDRDGHIKLTDFGLCTGFRWTHNSKYYQRNGEHGRQDSMDIDENNWTNECRCHDGRSSNLPVLKPLERRRLENEHQRCLAHSLVGTPNYIAPEVLMRTGYTQLCDWWSVGVILYEMLVGQPPFLANTPAETQFKVTHFETHLRIPKQAKLTSNAEDLILKLCTSHDERLGKNGATEVKAHPYFEEIDFKEGLRRQKAPYLPTILDPTDTSNFDPVDPEKLRNGDSNDPKSEGFGDDGKHPDHAFFEFTFRRFFDDGGHAYPSRIGIGDNDGQNPVYV